MKREIVRYRVAIAILFVMTAANLMARPHRKPADADPAEFNILMPDYHRTPREKWIDQVNALSGNLRSIADEALIAVADDRLSIDKRVTSLMVVKLFSAKVVAKSLIESIELRDDRAAIFGDAFVGPLPVVTILANYGEPVVDHIQYALCHEANPHRRELLCDVLEKVAGVPRAIEVLGKSLAKEKRRENEKQNLRLAIEELNSRNGATSPEVVPAKAEGDQN